MNNTQKYIRDVDVFLKNFLEDRINDLIEISKDAQKLIESITDLALGGKRIRAQLCYLAYRLASGVNYSEIVKLGASLEMFQTAALIHDDIIDNSYIRRGKKTIHTQYSSFSNKFNTEKSNYTDYGISSAILGGDICLSWSEQIFAQIIQEDLKCKKVTRDIFDKMRFEVMVGQFMDIHERTTIHKFKNKNSFERAFSILTYKSAKYSVEYPLLLGASLANASEELLNYLRSFGLPLGQAFQLQDDLLGVFGDPNITGKPAGDDIREGKRTVLIAYTLKFSNINDSKYINSMLGNANLKKDELEKILKIINISQAPGRCKALIKKLINKASNALEEKNYNVVIKNELKDMVKKISKRNF